MEICRNNEWGTVCDDGWGRLDATVVCRQLDLSIAGEFLWIAKEKNPSFSDAVYTSNSHVIANDIIIPVERFIAPNFTIR